MYIRQVLSKYAREIIVLIFTILSFLAGFAWQIAQDNYHIGRVLTPTIPENVQSILITVFGMIATISLANLTTKNRYLEEIETLRRDLKTFIPIDTRVVYKGRIDQTMDYLDRKIRDAKFVKNTCVAVREKSSAFDNYLERHNKKIAQQVSDLIERDGKWEDIVSTSAIARIIEIRKKVGKDSRYSGRQLKSEMPIINFIILEDEQTNKEVLFGFGLNDFDPDGYIFATNDERMIHTFSAYFSALQTYHSTFPEAESKTTQPGLS